MIKITTRRLHRAALAALLVCLALCTAACGGGTGDSGPPPEPIGPCGSGGGPLITVSGQVSYVRPVLGITGLGPATETRSARHVDVEVHNAATGACYGRGSTDATGFYSLDVDPPVGAAIEVVAYSRTLADPARDLIVHEADPPFSNLHSETNAFFHASTPFVAATTTADILVPYTGGPTNRPSIGFGVLDTVITSWDASTAAIGASLPRCHVYTRLGNNFALGQTSYYDHSVRSLAFLGGSAGLPDNSDTDYFDDAVVAHEYMHYFDKHVSHNMSRGGSHSGQLLEPNFSWSEGCATGFGCLLLRDPNYIDTFSTDGGILFRWNIENVTASDNDTLADEVTVAEIVYDLGDGGAGPADGDADGVNATYAELFGALATFDPSTDAPYIGLFLDRVVAATAITPAAMGAFLAGPPEDQQISYPLVGDDVWPTAIGLGGLETGMCDSTVDNPCRGYLASRWFQFTLTTAQVVTIDLAISPLPGTADDLDLYLTRNSDAFTPIASSRNAGATPESINVSLAAGTYIIRVEANCGALNRANFTLSLN